MCTTKGHGKKITNWQCRVVWPMGNNHFEWNMGKTKDVKRCVKEPTQPIGWTFEQCQTRDNDICYR